MPKQRQSLLTFKNLLLFVMAVVLIYLLQCNDKKVIEKPVVKPSTEIVQETIDLTAITKHISDSFTLEISEKDRKIQKQNSEYDDLLTEYLNYQNDIQGTLTNTPIPDTCKPIVSALTKQFNTLKKSSADKDISARNLIASLKEQNKTKDKFLSAKDTAIKKYVSLLDTCTKSYAAIEKYVKKVTPKREINVGAKVLSEYSLPLNTIYGLELGYRNKKGFEINVGYYSNNQVSVGLSKTLFKF